MTNVPELLSAADVLKDIKTRMLGAPTNQPINSTDISHFLDDAKVDAITEDTVLMETFADSLDIVEFIIALERIYGIVITEEDADHAVDFGKLTQLIFDLIQERNKADVN